MYKVSAALLLLLNLSVASAARPNRVLLARMPQGTQFITGACASDADCASGCCAANTGLCAARLVAEEGAGCGFGGAAATTAAAAAAAATSAVTGSGKPPGTQFITGPCAGNADCASGCCGFKSGLCAARLVALETDGCGFGQATADFSKTGDASDAASATADPAAGAATDAATSSVAADAATSSAVAGSGKPPGTQFITGPCANDGECASGCCGFKSGKCAGAIVAQQRDGGCGFGDAQPNNNAAVALVGPSAPKPGQA